MLEANGVLGAIVRSKREELRSRYSAVSIDALRSRAEPSLRSLAEAVGRPGARFILEVKRASPSQGTIRHGADVEAIVRGYRGVADALSVLTDGSYFGGSIDDLMTARRCFDGPILAKDFFIDLRQVAEARLAGADAILVMLSVLDDQAARAMIGEARRFGMDALVEVHDEREMGRALGLGARIIGINNRDLRDLSVDLATTERLAPLAPGRLLVSESGIGSRADVERLAPRVDAFLVGTSLMRADRPAQAARALVFGRVKLCGLNSAADLAAGAPAAFAGFVFVPGSPRHVTADEAAPLAGATRRAGVLPVGVFRDAPVAIAAEIATLLNLHAIQLHGSEDVEYVQALKRELPRDCELWKAVSVGRDVLSSHGADRVLFDNGDGGTGRCFDWSIVRHHRALGRGLLAGGIGPHNARSAARLGAYGIDAGSAVDAVPGTKSPEKIRQLFEALRPSAREGLQQCA